MPKNIVVFADGTGNDRAQGVPTNVAKLCERSFNLRVHQADHKEWSWTALSGSELDQAVEEREVDQITFYDAGVGTGVSEKLDRWLWTRTAALIGSATGSGISRNIQDCYDFIVRFYEPGDRIFLFGFSRGAYTARSLGGLLGLCGVPRRDLDGGDLRHDAKRRAALVARAYDVYKTGSVGKDASLAKRELGAKDRSDAAAAFRSDYAYPIHEDEKARAPYFIGVWDTVRSLGIPLRGRDWEIQFWKHRFHNHELSEHVAHAYHALSIDDPREAFHPTIWNEPTRAQKLGLDQKFEQVWFPGVHCDVGGGYENASLSDHTLCWMIDRVLRPEHPLLLVANPKAGLSPMRDPKIHEARDALWKRVVYAQAERRVARGEQEPCRTAIKPLANEEAFLDECLYGVLGALYDERYNPANMKHHPDYRLAISQIQAGVRPPAGPWTWRLKP